MPLVKKPTTIGEVNELNRQFWMKRQQMSERQLSSQAIFEIATWRQQREAGTLPVGLRKSFEAALDDAEQLTQELRPVFLREFSQRGVRSRKSDALHQWMMDIVIRRPDITSSEMLDVIRRSIGTAPIQEVDQEEIFLFEREKPVPISGLKDRLSRVKKELKNRATG